MPYFTAASVVRFYVFRGIFFHLRRAHTLPCPSAKDYTRTESSDCRFDGALRAR